MTDRWIDDLSATHKVDNVGGLIVIMSMFLPLRQKIEASPYISAQETLETTRFNVLTTSLFTRHCFMFVLECEK